MPLPAQMPPVEEIAAMMNAGDAPPAPDREQQIAAIAQQITELSAQLTALLAVGPQGEGAPRMGMGAPPLG